MPSLQSIREAERRAQSQRVQQRLTASTPQNAQRRARAEQERAATKTKSVLKEYQKQR